MGMGGRLLLLLLLLLSLAAGGGGTPFCQVRARSVPIFTVDVAVPGFSHSLEDVDGTLSCALLLAQCVGCQSFGFSPDSGLCLLYDHLVQYTTNGTAAPGTRYYWLLSPGCPVELGYTLDAGVCYRFVSMYSSENTSIEGHHDVCSKDGGHLFIADTAEKLDILKQFPFGQLGASDVDVEGYWRWVNGKPAMLDGNWDPGYPRNSTQHNCLRIYNGKFRDKRCDLLSTYGQYWYSAVCELPL